MENCYIIEGYEDEDYIEEWKEKRRAKNRETVNGKRIWKFYFLESLNGSPKWSKQLALDSR